MHLMVGNKTAYKITEQPIIGQNYIFSANSPVPSLGGQAKVNHKLDFNPDSKYAEFQQTYSLIQRDEEPVKQKVSYLAKIPTKEPRRVNNKIFYTMYIESIILIKFEK